MTAVTTSETTDARKKQRTTWPLWSADARILGAAAHLVTDPGEAR